MISQPQLRFISYGGGVQSTGLLVLAVQRRVDFQTFVMANVGDDSEHPATLQYVREIAMPYAAEHGIDMHLVDRIKRDGTVETLYGRLMREGSRSLPIPVRMSNGAPGQRSCTADFKIRVTGKWAKNRGATVDNPAVVGIGISRDEIGRANNRRTEPHERVVYPLVGIGEETGLMLSRQDCMNLIAVQALSDEHSDALRDLGPEFFDPYVARQLVASDYRLLPIPPKSSCYFCPFHRPSTWDAMSRDEPALFEKAAALEDTLNARRTVRGKDPVYLTRFNKPLRTIVVRGQDSLWQEDPAGDPGCDSGWCMT